MIRFAFDRLETWAARPRRKPLVIRGARQVGKTTLVRLFARQRSLHLIELNLERDISPGGGPRQARTVPAHIRAR